MISALFTYDIALMMHDSVRTPLQCLKYHVPRTMKQWIPQGFALRRKNIVKYILGALFLLIKWRLLWRNILLFITCGWNKSRRNWIV